MHFVKIVVLGASNVGKTSIIQVRRKLHYPNVGLLVYIKSYLAQLTLSSSYLTPHHIPYTSLLPVLQYHYILPLLFTGNKRVVKIYCIMEVVGKTNTNLGRQERLGPAIASFYILATRQKSSTRVSRLVCKYFQRAYSASNLLISCPVQPEADGRRFTKWCGGVGFGGSYSSCSKPNQLEESVENQSGSCYCCLSRAWLQSGQGRTEDKKIFSFTLITTQSSSAILLICYIAFCLGRYIDFMQQPPISAHILHPHFIGPFLGRNRLNNCAS